MVLAQTRNPNIAILGSSADKFDRAISDVKSKMNDTAFLNQIKSGQISDVKMEQILNAHLEDLQHAYAKMLYRTLMDTRSQTFLRAAKAKADGNPAKYIDWLEANPENLKSLPGYSDTVAALRSANQANKEEAKVLGQFSQKLKNHIRSSNESYGQRPQFVRVSYKESAFEETSSNTKLLSENEPPSMYFQDPLTVALIALLVAYLGVEAKRLATGEIKSCFAPHLQDYRSCIRAAGSNTAKRAECFAEAYAWAELCIFLPF